MEYLIEYYTNGREIPEVWGLLFCSDERTHKCDRGKRASSANLQKNRIACGNKKQYRALFA